MTKLRYRLFFIFIILNMFVPLCSMPNFSQIYSVVQEKKLILLFLLFLVTVAISDIRPTQFYNSETLESDHAPCEI